MTRQPSRLEHLALTVELVLIAVLVGVIVALLVPTPSKHTPSGYDPEPAQPVVTTIPPAVVRDSTPVDVVSIPALLAAKGEIAEPIIGGRATWYQASGMIGAAGPALRSYLGSGWRGDLVSVCHGSRCVVVKLTDWCDCRGNGYGRLLDLSDDAFAQLAPLSKGVIGVSITRRVHRPQAGIPELPPTDTEP